MSRMSSLLRGLGPCLMNVLGFNVIILAMVLTTSVIYLMLVVVIPAMTERSQPWKWYFLESFMAFFGVNILGNYVACVATDPGSVQSEKLPSKSVGPQARRHGNMSSDIGNDLITYCSKCGSDRPPRAHHCYMCGKCVLRMDHHCPWINACAGYYNYRFFFLFLFYLLLGCIYTFTLCAWYSMHHEIEFVVIYLLVITASIGLAMLGFVGFAVHLLTKNLTVIEFHQLRDWRAYLQRSGRPEEDGQNVFDVGLYRNLKEMFGSVPSLWCLLVPPVFWGMSGDGHTFPLARVAVPQTSQLDSFV